MAEFGFTPADGVEVRVLDSTADLRYLVLPARPAGSDGMSEEELARLVTRDNMVGGDSRRVAAGGGGIGGGGSSAVTPPS